MLETIGNKDVYVRNYTSNFDIKEYVQNVMIPKAFPGIPMTKLNLGLIGVVSEMVSNGIEDVFGTASLMMNESFINRAVLPSSIYSHASLYDLGYSYAVPSKCSFAIQMSISDIIRYSSNVRNTTTQRYRLDKDTKLVLGDNIYTFDYDIIIDHQFIDGTRVFNVYYDMDSNVNSISNITNKYIKHRVSSIDWLVLIIDLREYTRKVDVNTISDNLVTTNSDIELTWSGQIAGIDLTYVTPRGDRQIMKMKNMYTKADVDPFVWYKFKDDNTIVLSFSSNTGYFSPAFNSKIESTIYTCRGSAANFDSYNRKAGVPVQRTGDRFEYNASTQMVALCYSGSTGGLDKGDIELLRDDVILAHNTANVLSTDNDLQLWFDRYAKRYDTKSKFYKRRDDPTGRLFSQFIAIVDNTYIYPTNTLGITVKQDEFDYVNKDASGTNQEFIIKPGHIWEYNDSNGYKSIDTVRMIKGAMITDEALPPLTSDRQFMFVNPFYIKIYRDPTTSVNYNTLINHTSWPTDVPITSESFYQFQLATFSIERSLSKKNNRYHIEIICVPVVTDDNMVYVNGIGDDYPVSDNNLRLILVTRSNSDSETGYIEMVPTEMRNSGAVLFEVDLSVDDNIRSDMTINVNLDETPGMKSLISTGERKGEVYIDTNETSFHFICLMKDFQNKMTTSLFGDTRYNGYLMTNRFANEHRDLMIFKPLSMMRSVITFEGENDNYTVNASLIPFLKYDIPLDDDKMNYFIQTFDNQYKAVEPILNQLDGNSFLDFKLYNTYGRSMNYYIGPEDGKDVLWDSELLLDSTYIKIKFRMAVHDRSMYSQTVDAVVNDIKSLFDELSNGDRNDIHASDIIHTIINNQPNVSYIRFLGFNDYDANKQSIFVKYSDISELKENQLQPHVPEMLRFDASQIEIVEEIESN